MKRFGIVVAATSLLAVAAFASVESGLKVGAMPGPFQVVDVTGPSKGKQLCYRCQYGASAVMAAFVNGDVAKSATLLADMQKIVDAKKDKGLRAFVVYMGGPETKVAIEKLAKEKKITIPLTFLPSGPKEEDIASYKINATAKNTILIWKQSSVKGNFVDVDTTKVASISKAVDAMLQ